MHQRADETAGCASQTKFEQQPSIDISSHRPEALRRPDQVRHGDSSDREPRIDAKCQNRSQKAADAKAGDRSDAARGNSGECNDNRVEIQSGSWSSQSVARPCRMTTSSPRIIASLARWLKQLDWVARWIVEDYLGTSGSGDDIVSEVDTC